MNCRSIAEKGPTTEEKVMAIEASLATYEAKISGLGKTSRRTRTCSSLHSTSRIHERTFSLRFLSIILRVLRLEVSVYNVNNTNQCQTTFAQWGGGGGVKSLAE
jgi:hypothetical protein